MTIIKTQALDISKYLNTTEEMATYLQAVLEENNPALFRLALGDIAKGMSDIASQTQVNYQNLYKSLSANANPTFETINQIIHSLGLKITIQPALTNHIMIEKTLLNELTTNNECFPASFVDKLMDSDYKIRVWREYRNLTTVELAQRVGVSQSYISDIENGKKDGSIKVIKAIADALDADIETII